MDTISYQLVNDLKHVSCLAWIPNIGTVVVTGIVGHERDNNQIAHRSHFPVPEEAAQKHRHVTAVQVWRVMVIEDMQLQKISHPCQCYTNRMYNLKHCYLCQMGRCVCCAAKPQSLYSLQSVNTILQDPCAPEL